MFRDLPGLTRDQYTAVQHAAADAARRTSAAGRQVTYRGGFFLPAAARAICIFDADTAADVTAVNQLAGLPAITPASADEDSSVNARRVSACLSLAVACGKAAVDIPLRSRTL